MSAEQQEIIERERTRLKEHVSHEETLINNRMTWLLTIQGFLFGVVEAGAVWSVAPAAVREVIADFAEIARLRGGGLDDEDDEGAYAELVEYVRMGTMLVYGEQAPEGAAGGRPG